MSAGPAQPTFFVSYAHEDEPLAQKLAVELERLGAKAWIDTQNLEVGEPLESRIESAVRQADVFLLLLTDAAGKSKWVERELQMALASEEGRGRTKVLPVRLDGAPVPTSLSGFVWLDARSDQLNVAANELAAVGRQRSRESGRHLASRVETVLSEVAEEWASEPIVGGIRPDFLATLPGGAKVVIEAKTLTNPTLADLVRSRTQAARLSEVTGADASLIVYPEMAESLVDWGVVGASDLREALLNLTETLSGTARLPGRESEAANQDEAKTVFAAMPFDPEYSDVYWVAMVQASQAVNAGCIRVDQDEYTGEVPARIRALIADADAVIADISEGKANVLYETGFAHALEKATIHICSTPLDDLPFDVSTWNTIPYGKGQTHQLTEKLIRRLRSVLGDST